MHASYEEDFYEWLQGQSSLLRKKDFAHIDLANLIEEIETLGRERAALVSHLENLLMHLLKINYQPAKHTRSWDLSVKNARKAVDKILKNNPSFQPYR